MWRTRGGRRLRATSPTSRFRHTLTWLRRSISSGTMLHPGVSCPQVKRCCSRSVAAQDSMKVHAEASTRVYLAVIYIVGSFLFLIHCISNVFGIQHIKNTTTTTTTIVQLSPRSFDRRTSVTYCLQIYSTVCLVGSLLHLLLNLIYCCKLCYADL